MKQSSRYRIVGGVFFLSLALIFVPMLFEDPPDTTLEIEPLIQEPLVVQLGDEERPDPAVPRQAREDVEEILDEDGFFTDTGVRVGEPVLFVDTGNARQWAVQLASFSSDERAFVLRDRLKDDSYTTWLSHVKIGGEPLVRVAVGPFKVRADADALRDEVARKYGLDAIVVGFSL